MHVHSTCSCCLTLLTPSPFPFPLPGRACVQHRPLRLHPPSEGPRRARRGAVVQRAGRVLVPGGHPGSIRASRGDRGGEGGGEEESDAAPLPGCHSLASQCMRYPHPSCLPACLYVCLLPCLSASQPACLPHTGPPTPGRTWAHPSSHRSSYPWSHLVTPSPTQVLLPLVAPGHTQPHTGPPTPGRTWPHLVTPGHTQPHTGHTWSHPASHSSSYRPHSIITCPSLPLPPAAAPLPAGLALPHPAATPDHHHLQAPQPSRVHGRIPPGGRAGEPCGVDEP